MVYKLFILLVIGVCFLEVKSSPRRGFGAFGGFRFDDEGGDAGGDEDQDSGKEDKAGDNNSEGHRPHHRHRPGFGFEGGLPFGNPASLIGPSVHAIRENFQKLPALPHQVLLGRNGLLQNFLPSNGDRHSSGGKTSTSTSTSTTTSKPEDKQEKEESPEKPSKEEPLKLLPKDFLTVLPKKDEKPNDKIEDSGKSSTTTSTEKPKDEKEPPLPTGNFNRRLINAPLRCQEDHAGNCREAF